MLANTLALFIGIIGGGATYLLGWQARSFLLFNENVLMLLYIYLTAQLQHTQIWIPFTGAWGRLFMSPAHHQLHHSADPAHFNCNMGASLAVWDWLVGSLFMPPARSPRLTYGASGFDLRPPWGHRARIRASVQVCAALAEVSLATVRTFGPRKTPAKATHE